MGRHTSMAAAEPPEDPETTRKRLIKELEDQVARSEVSQPLEIIESDRFKWLCTFTIKQPDGEFAREAIIRAATVWTCTKKKSDKRDADAVKFLANYFCTEGAYWGSINERRALPREVVDSWLSTAGLNPTSARTHRAVLYTAGRVLYPGEYPKPLAVVAKRGRAVDPASREQVEELYAIANSLTNGLQRRLLIVLDLATTAGLRSEEILALRGSDFSEIQLSQDRIVVVISVRRRGKLNRRVPVLCPIRQHRLLERARQVGDNYYFPTRAGGKPHGSSIANTFSEVRERGYRGSTVVELRNRWLLDMTEKRIPSAALAAVCGPGWFRSISDQMKNLKTYTTEELCEMLFEDEEEGR